MYDYKEIVEFRSCNSGCGTSNWCMCDLAKNMADEIERLRAALREIVKLDDEWKPETLDDYSGTAYEHCAIIARAALGEKE